MHYRILLYLLLALAGLSCQQKEATNMPQERYITVEDDIQLWVETFGAPAGEACLLISGAGANSSFWSDRLCDSLDRSGFYIIRYDHRDFGYSTKIDWEERPYPFFRLVEDAVAILDHLQVDQAQVVGHSMGGFIVQLLAIHFPERVRSLTSISSSTNSPTVPPPPEETWDIFLANIPSNDFEQDLPGFLPVWRYLNGTAPFSEELAVEYTRNLYQRQVIDGALGASHVKAQETLKDRSEALKSVQQPALIMHGAEDYAVPPYGAMQTAECLPNAQLVIIPKMGHLPFNHDILRRFEGEIIDFLQRNRGR